MPERDEAAPSRLSNQPAPQPVHPLPPDTARPTFAELLDQAQGDSTDYSPLAAHLDANARSALGLPAVPAPLEIDRATALKVRAYLLQQPDLIAQLPDSVRDLIHL